MMKRPSSFIPYQPKAPVQYSKGAVDFLRGNDRMAAILPAAKRLVALQKDCAASLPANCLPLNLENGQMTVAVPNAAFAAKLKHQLPKLQEHLLKRGWQVSAIRLKVQVISKIDKPARNFNPGLSSGAVEAFSQLENALETTPQNSALKAALKALVEKRRLRP